MLKRMISILLAGVMALSLVGCGAEDAAGAQREESVQAPNGEKLNLTEDYGISMFQYAGSTMPVGLGLPKLTDEEIDALLAENDPRKVKETITTLADFANYCYRGEFVFDDGLIFVGGAMTTCSGYQTILRRAGQCASMSSCFRYVLADDYDEVGYVHVNGHLMAYALCDGLYYLVNPADYVYYAGQWAADKWMGNLFYDEMGNLSGEDISICSSDFQDIADSLLHLALDPPVTYVYTCVSPGDYTDRDIGEFPTGTIGRCWYGSKPVCYFTFTQYDWLTQENIIDEKAIVMYGPESDFDVPFGGIHLDVNTMKTWETPPEERPAFSEEDCPVVVEYLKGIGAITHTQTELEVLEAEANQKFADILVETNGDLKEISPRITTAEDCIRLIVASGIKEGDNDSVETAFAKTLLYPDKIVELACRMLEEDYDEVGMIQTTPNDYYPFLYVKQHETYYIYDVLKATHIDRFESGVVFDSNETMIEYAFSARNDSSATMKAWPW